MRFICGLLLLLTSITFAQTDWQRWGPEQVPYVPARESHAGHNEQGQSNFNPVNAARSVYKFFISDLDGDNCPFSPSCSAFFVEAVQTTDIFQGALMFADRFTRDMNFIKVNHYPQTPAGRLFDPVRNYTLHRQAIKFIPYTQMANE